MATIPQTAGFAVSARPGINYLDPRLLDSGLRDVVGNVGRGREVVGRFAQLAEQEAMRPVRERMAQLQIQSMEDQAALNRLRLNTPIETVIGGGIEAVPRFPIESMLLEDGTMGEQRQAGEDIFETEIVRSIDPRTGQATQSTRRRRPIQTMEQITSQQSLIEQREASALAAQERARLQQEQLRIQEEYNRARAENERMRSEASMLRARDLADNPNMGFVDVKRADGRTYRQYFNKSSPQQIVHEVDRGTLSESWFAPGATINVQGAAPAGGAATPQDLLARFSAARPATTAATVAPEGARPPRAFSSEAEVEAAAASGMIRPGDKIIVNGRSATYR